MTERTKSALALYNFLSDVAANPKNYLDHEIASCLSRQDRLAAFSDFSLGIISSSLTSLKGACNLVPGGFVGLDGKRGAAKDALSVQRKRVGLSKPTTRAALRVRADSFKENLAKADEDLLLLSRMLQLVLNQAKGYAEDSRNPSVMERCRRDQLEIFHMMSLVRSPVPHLRLASVDGQTT